MMPTLFNKPPIVKDYRNSLSSVGYRPRFVESLLAEIHEALVAKGIPVKDVHVVELLLPYGVWLEFIVTLIRIKGEPKRRLTARTVPFELWDRRLMATGHELVADLVAAYRNSPLMAPIETPQRKGCTGKNCGCTDGVSHSPECHAEHNAQ